MSEAMNDDPMAGRVPVEPPAPQAPQAPVAKPEFKVPDYLANDNTTTPALYEATAAVLAETTRVMQRGKNAFHDYKYATIDDLREHVGKLIGKHGLSYEQHEVEIASAGPLLKVTYVFRLIHKSGERGPFEKVTALAMANTRSGPDDKAVSKTRSLALKDWVKSRFSIPTGDEMESAGGDEPDADPDNDAVHSLQGRGKPASRPSTKGNALDRLAERVAPITGAQPQQQQPRPDKAAQDQQRQNTEQSGSDENAKKAANRIKGLVLIDVSASPDPAGALLKRCTDEKTASDIGKLKAHYAAVYADLLTVFQDAKVVGHIGALQQIPGSELYDDIVAASQKQAA